MGAKSGRLLDCGPQADQPQQQRKNAAEPTIWRLDRAQPQALESNGLRIVIRRQVMTQNYDVIVVGKGNAALCAALSAHEQGAKVVMLEAAPEE